MEEEEDKGHMKMYSTFFSTFSETFFFLEKEHKSEVLLVFSHFLLSEILLFIYIYIYYSVSLNAVILMVSLRPQPPAKSCSGFSKSLLKTEGQQIPH